MFGVTRNSWVTNQISDRHFSRRLSGFPVVFGAGEARDDRAQFLRAVGSKARDCAIEQHQHRNDRHHVGPEQPGPVKWTDPRRADEQHEDPSPYQEDCSRSAPRDFKYADAFTGVDSILKYALGLFWREMVERREHGAHTAHAANVHHVDRPREKSNVIAGSGGNILMRAKVWKLVGQPYLKRLGCAIRRPGLDPLSEIAPRSAPARTHIDNRLAARGVKHALQPRDHRPESRYKIDPKLKRIRDLVTNRGGQPRLFINFDEMDARHFGLSSEE